MDVRMDIPLADYGDDDEDSYSSGRDTSVRSDLSTLSHLTVDSVLDVLESRYAEDEIYVSTHLYPLHEFFTSPCIEEPVEPAEPLAGCIM